MVVRFMVAAVFLWAVTYREFKTKFTVTVFQHTVVSSAAC